MDAIIERCCGLDVHESTVVACLLTGPGNKKPRKETRTFKAFTRDLVALRDWLRAEKVTHVGMESTSVYWMPVYAVLEEDFELVVGNAQHIKNVPGRKTDASDAHWIADLVRHGLIRCSFIPPEPIRDLRDLTRYRRALVDTRSAECNRLIKVLEMASIKLAMVCSEVLGVSGTLMIRELIKGNTDRQTMSQLAKGRLRNKLPELELALDGPLRDHHRALLAMQLGRIDQLDADVAKLDATIEERLKPYAKQVDLLCQIPGVERTLAAVIIAEVGVDMSVFPSERHISAWAGVSPGNNESAGKKLGGRRRKGNVHLTTALVLAAHAAAKQRGTYLKDKYWRLKSRRGAKRAAIAIGRKILVIAYQMMKTGKDYSELGEDFLDRIDETMVKDNMVRRLERLGYEVRVEKKTAA
jgi:transposase